jgi:hypothetical protein
VSHSFCCRQPEAQSGSRQTGPTRPDSNYSLSHPMGEGQGEGLSCGYLSGSLRYGGGATLPGCGARSCSNRHRFSTRFRRPSE